MCKSLTRYRDHPDIAIPEFLTIKPWVDASMCDDDKPCSELKLADSSGFRVWVGYDKGKHPLGDNQTKFIVEFHRNMEMNEGVEVLYAGDSEIHAMYAMTLKKYEHLAYLILNIA